jgi:CHAD domain-containing protein
MMRQTQHPVTTRLLETIDHALTLLGQQAITDEAAHDARKALKRARAGLRLLRRVVGEKVYQRENHALRDAGRAISELRDAKVQLDTASALREGLGSKLARETIDQVEQRLLTRLAQTRSRLQGRQGVLRKSLLVLQRSKRRLGALTHRAIADQDIRCALLAIYRRSRKAHSKALKHPRAQCLHEWRKQAKYLSNGINLLDANPRGSLRKVDRRAKHIADWLGDEHDLYVMRQALSQGGNLGRAAAHPLSRLIRKRRSRLQQKALHCGEQLYRRKAVQALAT